MENRSIKCLRANKRIMVGIVVLAMIFCLVQSPNAYGEATASEATEAAVLYNGLSYATLGEALEAVDNSDQTEDRLVLQRDITIDGIVETGEISKNVTLDLNGFRIGGSKDGALLCVNDGTLTLENGTIENGSPVDTAIAISGNMIVPDSMRILPETGWQTSKSVTVEKKTYRVSTATYCNGKVSQIAGAVFPETSVVGYGDNLDLAITPSSGYRIQSIVVNGRNVGSGSTHVLMDVREDKEIVVNFEPDGLRIMLDPGHGDKEVNQEGSYKEHERMWLLTNYLKLQLEKYENVFIGMTKSTVGETPGVVERGTMSAGFDLLISMHSNWSGDNADYPLAIVSSGVGLWSKSYYVGEALATTVRNTMNTNQNYQVWTKTQSDGRDWYGVIRGAASVGTPAIILEHSFHSNANMRGWLMNDSNLYTMAKNEAGALANYYGLKLKPNNGTPSSLKGKVVSETRVDLNWSGTGNVTGYSIYRSMNPVDSFEYVGSTRGTAYSDSQLAPKTTYYYKVKAYTRKSDGTVVYSGYSGLAVAKTVTTVSTVPTGLKATPKSYSSIDLNWNTYAGASGYNIYRSTSPDEPFDYYASTRNTSFTDAGLKENTTYYYRITAYTWNGDGTATTSARSSLASATTLAKPTVTVGTPTNVKVSAKSLSSAGISWSGVTGASGYNIYRSTSKEGGYGYVKSTRELSSVDAGLTSGKTYYYKVAAYRWVESGRAITGSSSLPAEITLPNVSVGTPVGVNVVPLSETSIRLNWNAVTGASGYNIYRSTSKEGGYSYLKSTRELSSVDAGLTSGETYYYKVSAYSWVESGRAITGNRSTSVGITPPHVYIGVPTGVKAVPLSRTSIRLSWNKVTGASGYNLYRSLSPNGPYNYYTSTRNLFYSDLGLRPGTRYYYRVAAYRWIAPGKAVTSGTSSLGYTYTFP